MDADAESNSNSIGSILKDNEWIVVSIIVLLLIAVCVAGYCVYMTKYRVSSKIARRQSINNHPHKSSIINMIRGSRDEGVLAGAKVNVKSGENDNMDDYNKNSLMTIVPTNGNTTLTGGNGGETPLVSDDTNLNMQGGMNIAIEEDLSDSDALYSIVPEGGNDLQHGGNGNGNANGNVNDIVSPDHDIISNNGISTAGDNHNHDDQLENGLDGISPDGMTGGVIGRATSRGGDGDSSVDTDNDDNDIDIDAIRETATKGGIGEILQG